VPSGKPVYTCPQCQETYEGEIHACAETSQPITIRSPADLATRDAAARAEPVPDDDPAAAPDAGEIGTRPTLPSTPAARAAVALSASTAAASTAVASEESRAAVTSGSDPAPSGPGTTAATTVRTDALIGEVVAGRYRIVRKLGEGGMGAVYQAQHVAIGKRVAVKVLLDKYAQKRDVVARLQQEARLASAIGHPSIVDVNDFGETADGRSFVVMEFLEGESLAQLIAREAPLPPERVLPIIRQAADALSAAHDKGILHRDVKPENVFVHRRGDRDQVKVLDFGISKAMKKPGEDDDASPRLTQTGMVLGTPLYMSPEQARGESEVDERIDIYALGIILYEALSGETPFRGTNYLGIINQVLTQEATPLRTLRPDLPLTESLERVVMKMMHKDRNRRYRHMVEVTTDIDRLVAGDQNVGMPVVLPEDAGRAGRARDPARGRTALLLGGIALAVLVGLLTVYVSSRRAAQEPSGPPLEAVLPQPAADASAAPGRTVNVPITANVPCLVYEGDREVARSGDSLPLRAGERVTLTCRADGFQDDPKTFIPREGSALAFRLEPRVRPRPHSGRPAAPREGAKAPREEPVRETLPTPYHHRP
jgi:serine/threonine-protein kinase